MAWVTPKTNWVPANGVVDSDLNRIEENTRILGLQGGAYGAATGSANTYVVTAEPPLPSLADGALVAVKINVANTGASTLNVNGLGAKTIKKSNGNDVAAGNLKAGTIYSFRYNATTTNFILQGEGGGGTAVAGDVLAGKTFTNDNGDAVGTMSNRSGEYAALAYTPYTPPGNNPRLYLKAPDGFYPGTYDGTNWNGVGNVWAEDADFVAGNIKANINLFGVNGTFTSDGTATTGDIISGKRAYVNGAALDGVVPLKTSTNGDGGTNWHLATEVAGIAGTGVFLRKWPIDGSLAMAFKGDCWLEAFDTDFIASNIRNGTSLFGLTGTLIEGTPYATGSATSATTSEAFVDGNGGSTTYLYYPVTVSGLTFTPSLIVLTRSSSSDSDGYTTIYRPGIQGASGRPADIMVIRNDGQMLGWVKATSNAWVTSSGFRLPTACSNRGCAWMAYTNS